MINKLDKRHKDAIKAITEMQKKFQEYRKHVEELNKKKEESKNENYNNV